MENKFNELFGIDVSGWTEIVETGRASFTYLSWAVAWKLLKEKCPDANYKVFLNDSGLPFFDHECGALCRTSVTVSGETLEMWLPVMNSSNVALRKEPVKIKKRQKNGQEYEQEISAYTMFDINTTIMRCLAKNIAMFGLGLSLYIGEDIEPISLPSTLKKLESAKDDESLKKEFLAAIGKYKNPEIKDIINSKKDELKKKFSGKKEETGAKLYSLPETEKNIEVKPYTGTFNFDA